MQYYINITLFIITEYNVQSYNCLGINEETRYRRINNIYGNSFVKESILKIMA